MCPDSWLTGLQIPTLASCSFDEIIDAAQPGQAQFLQLYVNKDRKITERFVRHAEARERGDDGLWRRDVGRDVAPARLRERAIDVRR